MKTTLLSLLLILGSLSTANASLIKDSAGNLHMVLTNGQVKKVRLSIFDKPVTILNGNVFRSNEGFLYVVDKKGNAIDVKEPRIDIPYTGR